MSCTIVDVFFIGYTEGVLYSLESSSPYFWFDFNSHFFSEPNPNPFLTENSEENSEENSLMGTKKKH